MRLFIALGLLSFSAETLAGPRIVCAIDGHHLEQELKFEPFQGQTYLATNTFTARSPRDLVIKLQVKEQLNGGKVRYSAQLSAEQSSSNRKWLGPNNSNRMILTLQGKDIHVDCSAYERTEDGRSVPANPRERLRRAHFNDGPASREYVRGKKKLEGTDDVQFFPTDAHDLLRLVLTHDTVRGPLAKIMFDNISHREFPLRFTEGLASLYQTDAECPREAEERLCDIERVGLEFFSYSIKRDLSYFAAPSRDTMTMGIALRIYREKKSRWIIKYEIEGYSSGFPAPETGGQSSTSGGRISPN